MNTSLYITLLSREDSTFKNRSWEIYTSNKVQVIPIEDGLILCDVCNTAIKTETIYLLQQDGGIEFGVIDRGALCEKCRLNMYPHIPVRRPQKVEYWLIVNKKPLWIGPDLEELKSFKEEYIEGTPPTLMILERPLCPRCNIVANTRTNICPICEQDVGETKVISNTIPSNNDISEDYLLGKRSFTLQVDEEEDEQ